MKTFTMTSLQFSNTTHAKFEPNRTCTCSSVDIAFGNKKCHVTTNGVMTKSFGTHVQLIVND